MIVTFLARWYMQLVLAACSIFGSPHVDKIQKASCRGTGVDLVIMIDGELKAIPAVEGEEVGESSKNLCDLINAFMRDYEVSNGIVASQWFPRMIPGSRVMCLPEPIGSHLKNGKVLHAADADSVFYLWTFVDGKWSEGEAIRAEQIYEVSSRDYTLVGSQKDGSFFLYDVRSRRKMPFDSSKFGEVMVSSNGTFVSFTRSELIYGAIVDLDLVPKGTLMVPRDDMITDWHQFNTYISWYCDGNLALFGNSWCLNMTAGTLVQLSREWSVPVGESVTGERLVRKFGSNGREYAVFDLGCENAKLLDAIPLPLPESQQVWAYDLSRGYSIQRVASWIPGGWPTYNVRCIWDGQIVSRIRAGRFVGILVG